MPLLCATVRAMHQSVNLAVNCSSGLIKRLPKDRGREVRLSRTPLPPNRTGGFPAYGSPVSRFLWTDRTEHGLLAGYRDPDRRSIPPLTLSSKSVVSMLSVQTANEAHWPIAGGSTIGIAVNGTVIATYFFARFRGLLIIASTFLSPFARPSYVVLASSLL